MSTIGTLKASLTGRVKVLVLVVALVVGCAIPYVVNSFILSTMTLALIYGLFAMSINLLARGGLITLGHGAMFGTAAYGVGYVATQMQGGHAQQIVIGMACAMLLCVVYALMAMRTKAGYFIMVTLAQGMIIYGLANSLQPITGGENGLTGVSRPAWVNQDWQFYYVCLLVLSGCAGLIWVITRSPFGLALRGLDASESRLQMLGYNPTLHKFYGFMLAGFFGSISGVLFVYNNEFVSPSSAAFLTSASGVLMIILGGIRTMSGPLIGAIVIVFIQNWLSVYVDRWPTVLGLIFIGMILFAQDGFVGGVARLWNNWLARESRAELADAGSAVLVGVPDGMPAHLAGEPRRDQDQRSAGDSSEVDTSRKREEP